MNYRPFPLSKVANILFVTIALLVSPVVVNAQTNIAVAPNKMNVLYIGVDNPVSIAASGATDEKVTVSVEGGGNARVSKIGTGLYNVQVSTVVDDCLINVFIDGKLAGTSKFRVRNLPVPTGTIGGFMSGSNIKAAVFKEQAGLATFVKNFPFKLKHEVLRFKISVADEKGKIKTAECEGASFSSVAKDLIHRYVKPGQVVSIQNIWVKEAGGRDLKLPALVYHIN